MRRHLLLSTLALVPLWAANHALVVGVGEYQNFPRMKLDGPPHDARVLAATLLKSWGFSTAHVRVLIDAKATRSAILTELDALTSRIQPGDQVFLYFSGHGTSAFDPKSGSLCSDVNSGCLIPHDVRAGTPIEVVNSLLIGSRDLRPRLEAMEARQPGQIFVVFDSCFSENAAKSVTTGRGETREMPLSSLVRAGVLADDYDAAYSTLRKPTTAPGVYPYQRVYFLAAAAKDEKAFDIPQWRLDAQQSQTIDGKPHGRFTDALLRGLTGEADANADGRISFAELHRFTLTRMGGSQTPQLQTPKETRDTTVLSTLSPVGAPIRSAAETPAFAQVRVDVSAAPALRAKLEALPGITLATSAPDLTVTAVGLNYALRLGNGLLLRQYGALELHQLVARVAAQAGLRPFLTPIPRNSKDAVELRLLPENKGVFRLGEEFEFVANSPRPVYFLLLNIDTAGAVSVVYPASEVSAAQTNLRINSKISEPPFGAEMMQLFAFPTRPSGYDSWAGQVMEAGDPRLSRLLEAVKAAVAESSLVLYSAETP